MNSEQIFYFGKDDTLINWEFCNSIEKNFLNEVFKRAELPYTIIVTENANYLPQYGQNIVVILKSDEFYSPIKYANQVKAIFRNYYSPKYEKFNNCYAIPLPYLGHGLSVNYIPFEERGIDIFFAGQVKHLLRQYFFKLSKRFEHSNRDLRIEIYNNSSFFNGYSLVDYYRTLANSKIALCPAGASSETYRHSESLKYGCISISMPLPKVWYFENSPIQIIDDWTELESKVKKILSSKENAINFSRQSNTFWNINLSPDSIAKYIREKLN